MALGVAGEEVEEGGGVIAEVGPAGEEAEVGVDAGGGGVVVAGAEVDVAADAVGLAADDEGGLAVGLEADDAVDDVDAGLLKGAGLVDVVFLVEAGLEFDEGGDLLAVFGGAGQGVDDGVVFGGAVEGLLDGEDLGVVGGLFDELDDGVGTTRRGGGRGCRAARMAPKMSERERRTAGSWGSKGGSLSFWKPSTRQRAISEERATGPGTG